MNSAVTSLRTHTWVLGLLTLAALVGAAACGDNKITWNECVTICGGDGNVCEFQGDGTDGPDGMCVCKDKSGNCPAGDAGAK